MSRFKRKMRRTLERTADLELSFFCVECDAECGFVVGAPDEQARRLHMMVRHREPRCARFESTPALEFLKASLPKSVERMGGTPGDLAELLGHIETLVSCGTLTEHGPFDGEALNG